jgi:hypothetical protein
LAPLQYNHLGPENNSKKQGSYVKRILTSGVALAVLLLSACASLESAKAPDANPKALRSFYVVQEAGDDHALDNLLSARLTSMGYSATCGQAAQPPDRVDAIVTYQDRWMWDITMYMIKLDVQLHDGESGAVIARAQSMRPSLQRKSPEAMVQEVLGEIFK